MSRTTLKQHWQDFQQETAHRIHAWYIEHYKHAYVDDPLIKYIVLWSAFNALYNTYDLPNNRIDKKDGRYKFKMRSGVKVPDVHVSGDFKRVSRFAEKLALMNSFSDLLNQREIRRLIEIFVDRIPHVLQSEDIDLSQEVPIVLRDAQGKWTVNDIFSPKLIRGISSLDHRLFLSDGYMFFEYASIEYPWNQQNELTDPDKTAKQLLTVLYQLRNNVVHGGVVSKKRKNIINDALPILERIVEFVFANVDQIFIGEKE